MSRVLSRRIEVPRISRFGWLMGLYSDARQVEATHCYAGRRWQDVIGMYPPPEQILDHRLRMNTFLGKWVQYLAEQGHGVATLRHATAQEIETRA